jgi:UDP-N-acetylglucosamine:LPS N-acetylglucosamine transferase
LGLDPARPLLVVLGGSQGAGSLNTFLRAHAPRLCDAGLQVFHQTGPGRLAEGCAPREGYRAVEFTRDVPQLLAAATLVLCRAGASTLLELAAAGAPAYVVPFPRSADGHQEHNARELGAGVRVVADADLGPALADELTRIIGPQGDPERAAMRAALLRAVPRDGAERAADVLLALAGSARAPARGRGGR